MRCLLVFAAVLFFSCNNKKEELPGDIANHQIFCDENFDVFFKKFKTDSLYQKQHIGFPLKLSYYEDTSGKEVYLVDEHIKSVDVKNMLILPENKLRANAQFEFEGNVRKFNDSVNYSFKRKNISRTITYMFVKTNDCWSLRRIFDDSLYQPDPFRQSKLKQFTNLFNIQ